MTCCTGNLRERKRRTYNCEQIDVPFVLPRSALIGMSVFDFDQGPFNDYTEQLTVPIFEYYVTPLLPANGNEAPTLDGARAYGTQQRDPS